MVSFSPDYSCVSLSPHRLDQLSVLLHLQRQGWTIPFIYWATSFVQWWCKLPTNWAGLWGYLQSRGCVVLTWWDCRFTWVEFGQLQDHTGRQESKVLCLWIMAGSGYYRYLQFSVLHFWSSNRGEMQLKERKKKKKKTFQQVASSCLLLHSGFWRLLCAIQS